MCVGCAHVCGVCSCRGVRTCVCVYVRGACGRVSESRDEETSVVGPSRWTPTEREVFS